MVGAHQVSWAPVTAKAAQEPQFIWFLTAVTKPTKRQNINFRLKAGKCKGTLEEIDSITFILIIVSKTDLLCS
jgi:hypothetical protein